jgi:hypothetical protein
MKKINLMVLLLALTTFANANYHKKETSVMKHSYISTPKTKADDCDCANTKKKTIVNKDREKKFVSAMHNSVKVQTTIN